MIEFPTSWKTVESGIVLETPIRLKETNWPTWAVDHRAPQTNEKRKAANDTCGRMIKKAMMPTIDARPQSQRFGLPMNHQSYR